MFLSKIFHEFPSLVINAHAYTSRNAGLVVLEQRPLIYNWEVTCTIQGRSPRGNFSGRWNQIHEPSGPYITALTTVHTNSPFSFSYTLKSWQFKSVFDSRNVLSWPLPWLILFLRFQCKSVLLTLQLSPCTLVFNFWVQWGYKCAWILKFKILYIHLSISSWCLIERTFEENTKFHWEEKNCKEGRNTYMNEWTDSFIIGQ